MDCILSAFYIKKIPASIADKEEISISNKPATEEEPLHNFPPSEAAHGEKIFILMLELKTFNVYMTNLGI